MKNVYFCDNMIVTNEHFFMSRKVWVNFDVKHHLQYYIRSSLGLVLLVLFLSRFYKCLSLDLIYKSFLLSYFIPNHTFFNKKLGLRLRMFIFYCYMFFQVFLIFPNRSLKVFLMFLILNQDDLGAVHMEVFRPGKWDVSVARANFVFCSYGKFNANGETRLVT